MVQNLQDKSDARFLCAFLPCHKESIAQNRLLGRESCYKSGISGTNFEGRLQNVKVDYKTGTSDCNRPVMLFFCL